VQISRIFALARPEFDVCSSLVEKMIIENEAGFFNQGLNPLIKCRFLLFIGSWLGLIFRGDKKEANVKILEYIAECINPGQPQAVQYQAVETLTSIIYKGQVLHAISLQLENIIILLAPRVKDAECPAFLGLMDPLLTQYPKILEDKGDLLMESIACILERIAKEDLVEDADQRSIKLLKCWGIIKSFVRVKNYFPKYLERMEVTLAPAIQVVISNAPNGYETQLLQTINEMLKTSKAFGPNTAHILSEIILACWPRKAEKETELYTMMNYLIYYGGTYLQQHSAVLQSLLQILVATVFTLQLEPGKLWLRCQALLLIHLLLHTMGETLPQEYIIEIFTQTVQTLQSDMPTYLRARSDSLVTLQHLT
jgi:hypothetical protein